MSTTACVILAAGLGTRMKSALPKVLHRVCGVPMVQSVIDAAGMLKPQRIVVVAGEHLDLMRGALRYDGVAFALQREPKGTGHALSCAIPALKGFSGDVVVLNGDAPLVNAGTIRAFLSRHRRGRNAVSVLSFIASNPESYGRIVRDETGRAKAVVEQRDADSVVRAIHEVNSGVYAIRSDALPLLGEIGMNAAKGEYYLTDIVALSAQRGRRTAAYPMGREEEFLGVNTRAELMRANVLMRRRIIERWAEEGVNFLDAESVFIQPAVRIGGETTVYPNVHLEGNTRIGSGVTIFPNVRVADSLIGDDAVLKDSTVIEQSIVRAGAAVGPFAHVRPGSDIGAGARIGNFVELKKVVVGRGSKASHLSYLGDARIGAGVNIGAGTITCNYDGERKSLTVIRDGAFIGSDTQLVAPVIVGKGAYVAAGSTITHDVPAESLALSRVRQKNLKGWAKRRKKEKETDERPVKNVRDNRVRRK